MQRERFEVVFTRLFYVFSACLSASMRELSQGLMSLEPWAFKIDVMWAEEVTFEMYSGAVQSSVSSMYLVSSNSTCDGGLCLFL